MSKEAAKEERLCSLMEQYEKSLLRMCCVYLRDTSAAEDAVQESFLRAYRSMDDFRGESSEKTWLYSIAMNVCRDMRRAAPENGGRGGRLWGMGHRVPRRAV